MVRRRLVWLIAVAIMAAAATLPIAAVLGWVLPPSVG
jgi:hypothetical protein